MGADTDGIAKGLRGPRQNGARACPPEDCGGGDGSHHLLESILDDEQDS